MCIIIFSSKGKQIPSKYLEIAFKNNPHGFGVMWVKDAQVEIFKGVVDLETVKNILSTIPPNTPYAIHMRLKTRGPIDNANAHPIKISNDIWMMHNGTFRFIEPDVNQSDTVKFAQTLEHIVTELGPTILYDKFYTEYMEDSFNKNKLIFLNSNNEFSIINEKQGFWEDDIWYSNDWSLIDGFIDEEFERRVKFENYIQELLGRNYAV